MKIGDKVKYSNAALRKDRDYYLSQGQPTKRAAALELYNKRLDKTGIIIGILMPPKGVHYLGHEPFAYEIEWNDGTMSKTANYLLMEVKP